MNKHLIIGVLLISTLIIISNIASALTVLTAEEYAQSTVMKDTTVDYTSYREIVMNEPGVVYLIKIINTGKTNKTYEIIPDASIIKSIGTYRIDPSDTAFLEPNAQQTFYIYLTLEKQVSGRIEIPVVIKSDSTSTTINLVARAIGPFIPETQSSTTYAFRIVVSVILAIVIIVALIFGLRRIRKKNLEEEEQGKEQEEDVETYY